MTHRVGCAEMIVGLLLVLFALLVWQIAEVVAA